MVAHQKEERLGRAFPNGTPKGIAVNIYSGFASCILVTKLQRRSATKGMAEYAEPLQIESSLEFSGGIGGVQLLQAVNDEACIFGPHGKESVGETLQLIVGHIFGIVCR